MPSHLHTMRCCAALFALLHTPPTLARSLGVQCCLFVNRLCCTALHCCCSAILFRSASWRTPAALSAGAELIRKQRGSVASGTTGGKMNEIARPVWQAAEALCALLCGATYSCRRYAHRLWATRRGSWHCNERLWLDAIRRTIHTQPSTYSVPCRIL